MNDNPKRPVETPREWWRYDEEDMSVAEREIQEGSTAYHTICFLCQSAAEKLLKGYLISQGWTLERTHDIVALLELASQFDAGWESMLSEGAVLNEYIIAGRYPGDVVFEEIGGSEAAEALESVRQIRSHLKELIKSAYEP